MKIKPKPIKQDNQNGITLIDTIIAAAILGILALGTSITMQILNSLKYQDQIAELNSITQTVLHDITHEIRNAARLTFQSSQPDILTIWKYDFERFDLENYGGNNLMDMFQRTITIDSIEYENWGRVTYEIVTEPGQVVDGQIRQAPFLKKTTLWEVPFENRPLIQEKVFFESFVRSTDPDDPNPTFRDPDEGSSSNAVVQSIEVALKLQPSFRKEKRGPLVYTAVATMGGLTSEN